jgi:hypothetical protein
MPSLYNDDILAMGYYRRLPNPIFLARAEREAA